MADSRAATLPDLAEAQAPPTLLEAAQALVREFSQHGHYSTDAMRRPVFIIYRPRAETEALLAALESAIARES